MPFAFPAIKIRRMGWLKPAVGITVVQVPLQELARLWKPETPSDPEQGLRIVKKTGPNWNIERIGEGWRKIRNGFVSDEKLETVAIDAMALFDAQEALQTVCTENEQVSVADHLLDVLEILASYQYQNLGNKPLAIIAALFLNAGRLPSICEKIASRVPSVSNLFPSQVANLFLDELQTEIAGLPKVRKAILYCGKSVDRQTEQNNRLIPILRHAEKMAWENCEIATCETEKVKKVGPENTRRVIGEVDQETIGETEPTEKESIQKAPSGKQNPSGEKACFDIREYFSDPKPTEPAEEESSPSEESFEAVSETDSEGLEVSRSREKVEFNDEREPEEGIWEEPESRFFFRLNEYQLAVSLGVMVSSSHLSCFMHDGFVYAEEEKMALALNEIRKRNGLPEMDYEGMEGYLEPVLCCIRKETCSIQLTGKNNVAFQEPYYVFNAHYFDIRSTDSPALSQKIRVKKIRFLREDQEEEIPPCFENAEKLRADIPPDLTVGDLAALPGAVDEGDKIAMTVFDTEPESEDRLVREIREKDILGRIGPRIDNSGKECFCFQGTVFVVREVIVEILNEIRKEKGLTEFTISSGQDYLFGVLQMIEFKQWQIFFTSAKYSRPIKRYYYTAHQNYLGTESSTDDHPWIKKVKLVPIKEDQVF